MKAAMADDDQHDELDGLSEDDAKRLLEKPEDKDEDGGSETDTTDYKAEAEKWKKLSRKNEGDFKATAAKLKQYEDQNKTEAERLQEAAESNRARAEKAESALMRQRIAISRAPEHATVAQIAKVAKRLAGDSEQDMEADADELWADYAPAPAAKPPVTRKPQERLRGGGDPDEGSNETDPTKLAALLPRR